LSLRPRGVAVVSIAANFADLLAAFVATPFLAAAFLAVAFLVAATSIAGSCITSIIAPDEEGVGDSCASVVAFLAFLTNVVSLVPVFEKEGAVAFLASAVVPVIDEEEEVEGRSAFFMMSGAEALLDETWMADVAASPTLGLSCDKTVFCLHLKKFRDI